MGSGQSSVLTVPSSDRRRDADLIRRVFRHRFGPKEDQGVGDDSTLLFDEEKNLVVILVHSEMPTNVAWVCDAQDILEASQRDQIVATEESEGFKTAKIVLAGGNVVIMVDSQLVLTPPGRLYLSQQLAQKPELATTAPTTSDSSPPESSTRSPLMKSKAMLKLIDNDGLPQFPTLDVRLLQTNDTYRPNYPVNSTEPIEFETEIFKGRVLFVIRPEKLEDDPYWTERVFAKKKRRMVLQIQGKFKRKPVGKIMIGAEISQKMKVGLLTKGILSLLIKLLQKFFSDLRYSFGDGEEWPRIVAPAHTAVESFIVTPPGETPPELCAAPFPETKESKAERARSTNFDWNTVDTYSMSYHTMYVDFPHWRLLGVPVVGDLDLKSVWNDSFLRIVLYEKTGKQKRHLHASNKYAFSLQLAQCEDTYSSLSEYGRDLSDLVAVGAMSHMLGEEEESAGGDSDIAMLDTSDADLPVFIPNYGDDDLHFFDAEETSETLSKPDPLPGSKLAPLLRSIDSVVPAWFDLLGGGRGSYTRTYGILKDSKLTFRTIEACEGLVSKSGAERRVRHIVQTEFSPRLSSPERLRRLLALSLLQGTQDQLVPFRDLKSGFDSTFLMVRERTPSNLKRSDAVFTSYVARAVSDRHWMEEWICVSDTDVSFHNPEKRKGSHMRVGYSNIHSCSILTHKILLFDAGYAFVVIETAGRCVYVMLSTVALASKFVEAVNSSRRKYFEARGVTSELMELDNPTDEFLHKSSMWNCKQRRILNSGRYSFRANYHSSPLQLAENALRLALEPSLEDDLEKRRLFLSSAAMLKDATPGILSESERLAFYLNVYHIMIMHAFLVLGPPGSSLKWISYFNNIAYQVGDDIFSLTELEHCIIRGNMAYPTQFVSRFILPKSRFKYALVRSDYRINFALNAGSMSNPQTIFVYKPDTLEEQLDMASCLYLADTTVVKKGVWELAIQLPRVCQWFSEDFGSHSDLLSKIHMFLKEEEREKLSRRWSQETRTFDTGGISIKYKNYSFQCRPLKLAIYP